MTGAARRVVHVIAPAPAGGAESVVVALTSADRERTEAVILNQLGAPGTPDLPLTATLRSKGVTVQEIRCGRRRYGREARALAELLREKGASVVHAHGYHADWVAHAAARRARVAAVATVHGYLRSDFKDRLLSRLDRWMLRRFDAVIAVSDAIAAELRASGIRKDRIHVVQNGMSASTTLLSRAEARRRLGIATDGPVVGWVGRLSYEKGADLFLEALARGDLPPAVIIGDGPEQARLAELARTLRHDSSGRVTFAGFQGDAAALLPAFDVLAMTSRSEGTPMIMLEAVAAELPVVAFAVGGIGEQLDAQTAWLVPELDVDAFARTLRSAIAAPDEARKRARAARVRLDDRLNVERWVERVWKAYERALAG
jgi:glycosyltransferase involved in cell wall biosynthesis